MHMSMATPPMTGTSTSLIRTTFSWQPVAGM